MKQFLDLLNERVLILDGAMGSNLQEWHLTLDDWGGKEMENCSEWLNFTRPDVIKEIHRSFLAVGCDAVETNSFGGARHVLNEFTPPDDQPGERCREINRTAAQIARAACNEFSTPDRPRFVIGSIGPGTKSPTLGHIAFDTLLDSYSEQVRGLIEGGADVILIETCYDILQAKAALIAATDVMTELDKQLPLMVQVTIEVQGTMLTGTDIAGALATLEAFPQVDVIGLNCATGPERMLGYVQHLSHHSSRKLSCLPNAGIPDNVDGKPVFPLKPDQLADWMHRFVTEYGFNIVGGCCGTTPEHLKAVVDKVGGLKPARREVRASPSVSSLFSAVDLMQDPRPLLVGERTNTNGSRKFKNLLEAEDWDGLVDMGREQEREGVHVLDVCTAFVGRDEVRDMTEVIKRYNSVITKPLMIDSTEAPVLEAALKLISGKAIINSINLEEGRKKIDDVVPLAKRYGAALVALTIDEEGQATTADWKFRVAKRIYDICTQEYDIPPSDLLFDTLVFPVTTGQEELRDSALQTLESIRRVKEELPGALTHIGLSNVSFGLTPYTRQVVNSVFLHYAQEYGLDSAILHASKIIPLARIDDEGRELARRVIFNERAQGDPLQQLMQHYADKKGTSSARSESLGDTVEERLKQAIIQGRRDSLVADLDLGMQTYSPLDIINNILLDGMKVVGELFGSGQMQLPFVLQSAEVMKAAVAHLEPFMEKADGSAKGKIVLATVKGDVHDIGKNLVDIILTNNGYKVFNIGIKQPIDNILAAAEEHQADAIGMSGLLVKSTVVMKEDLIAMNERGVQTPVILGGAALTRRYVEEDLRRIYHGKLFYGEDAFAGLRIMDELCLKRGPVAQPPKPGAAKILGGRAAVIVPEAEEPVSTAGNGDKAVCCPTHAAAQRMFDEVPAIRSSAVELLDDLPTPPFWGSRLVTDIPITEVFEYMNQRTLFSTQWQFRKSKLKPAEYERQMREIAEPKLAELRKFCLDNDILRPAVAYGFFRCASEGNDLILFEEDGSTERGRFRFPRQDHGDHLCLSDYFEPANGKANDVVGFMAVTVGHKVSEVAKEWFDANRYQDYLFLHGLGVEAAEALAEYWHQRYRRELAIADQDSTNIQKLFKKHYRGCRYAFGYPACPNLEDQTLLFQLIEPERIGMELSEQFQLEPEQSTTALIVHHPQARYFNVTRGDYAAMAE